MPTAYKSVQQTKIDATPREMLRPNEMGGRVRVAFWEFTVPAATLVINDTVDLVTLPKGARILGGKIVCEAMSTAGGTASADIGIIGTAAKYGDNIDVDAAGADDFAHTIALYFGELLTVETKIVLTAVAEAWAAAAKCYGFVLYAVD
jgi:hypothetical protein